MTSDNSFVFFPVKAPSTKRCSFYFIEWGDSVVTPAAHHTIVHPKDKAATEHTLTNLIYPHTSSY